MPYLLLKRSLVQLFKEAALIYIHLRYLGIYLFISAIIKCTIVLAQQQQPQHSNW